MYELWLPYLLVILRSLILGVGSYKTRLKADFASAVLFVKVNVRHRPSEMHPTHQTFYHEHVYLFLASTSLLLSFSSLSCTTL